VITVPTTDDIARERADSHAWVYDPDQVQVDPEPMTPPEQSSAFRHVARYREDLQDAAKNRDQVLDQLQAERKRRKAERAKTAGLTTAEILAARRLGTG
jgi:hypothetical protein